MTVQVRPLNIINQAVLSVLWEDNFAASGQTIADIRANYAFMTHGNVGSNNNPNNNIPSVGAVNNGLMFTGQGSAQPITGSWIPIKLGGASGRSQFAEAVVRWLNPAGFTRGGFGLLNMADHRGAAGGFNANYQWGISPDTNQSFVNETVNNVVTVLGAALALPSLNDKVAFTADFETTPGSLLLKVFFNEVEVFSHTDASIISTTGIPSIFSRNFTLNNQIEFSQFRAGVLSKLGYYA